MEAGGRHSRAAAVAASCCSVRLHAIGRRSWPVLIVGGATIISSPTLSDTSAGRKGKQAVAAATGGSCGGEGTKAPLVASARHPTYSATSEIAHLGPALPFAAPRARCRCSAWLSGPAAPGLLPVQPISCSFTSDQRRGMAKRGGSAPPGQRAGVQRCRHKRWQIDEWLVHDSMAE